MQCHQGDLDGLGARVSDLLEALREVAGVLAPELAQAVEVALQLEDADLEVAVREPDARGLEVDNVGHGVAEPTRERVAPLRVPVRQRLRPGHAVDGPQEGDQLVLEEVDQLRHLSAAVLPGGERGVRAVQAGVDVAVGHEDRTHEVEQGPGGLLRHLVLTQFELPSGLEGEVHGLGIDLGLEESLRQGRQVAVRDGERFVEAGEASVETLLELGAVIGRSSVDGSLLGESTESVAHLGQTHQDVLRVRGAIFDRDNLPSLGDNLHQTKQLRDRPLCQPADNLVDALGGAAGDESSIGYALRAVAADGKVVDETDIVPHH
ncbi:hypothetical protein PGQ11_014537 [Apiospora arundinis]|uniref:Uncharacterized protein n=1 Tax=Apiospora arundinis TaxID=335852 RepID=A0ABR2HSU9_9PEZI